MHWLSLLALLVLLAPLARAESPALPGKPYYVCASFPGGASAVTADVSVVGGSQIGANVTATQGSMDSAVASWWCLDLDTVSGFAATCDLRTYVVRFAPDGADCDAADDPQLCAIEVVRSGGPDCWAFPDEPTVVYASSTVPSRGITAQVIAARSPSYIKHEVKLDGGSVVFTWYQVFYYDSAGRVSRTPRTLTPPSP